MHNWTHFSLYPFLGDLLVWDTSWFPPHMMDSFPGTRIRQRDIFIVLPEMDTTVKSDMMCDSEKYEFKWDEL